VLGEAAKLTVTGVAIGMLGAFALTRFLSSMLFGVTPTDALTFIAVALILVGVAVLAGYVPTRGAMRVDPMVALRYE
jgi:putative ABC transport system permease protein